MILQFIVSAFFCCATLTFCIISIESCYYFFNHKVFKEDSFAAFFFSMLSILIVLLVGVFATYGACSLCYSY